MNNSLINVALPKLVSVFGSSVDTIQWVLTGYMLASAVVIPLSGFLGDKYGYKKIFLISLAGFTASSLLCGLAWNDRSLIVFRIILSVANVFRHRRHIFYFSAAYFFMPAVALFFAAKTDSLEITKLQKKSIGKIKLFLMRFPGISVIV